MRANPRTSRMRSSSDTHSIATFVLLGTIYIVCKLTYTYKKFMFHNGSKLLHTFLNISLLLSWILYNHVFSRKSITVHWQGHCVPPIGSPYQFHFPHPLRLAQATGTSSTYACSHHCSTRQSHLHSDSPHHIPGRCVCRFPGYT
jgi:hypothetical protein